MQNLSQTCHGQTDGMIPCSQPLCFGRLYKMWWRMRLAVIHFHWHLKDKGFLGVMKLSILKLMKLFGSGGGSLVVGDASAKQYRDDEVLNLKPGEWVEVKSEPEILATLDAKSAYNGLRWMCNMRKFCGKRFRVYKRLERMLLESKSEYRDVKNTVLLEGVICDGQEWFGCDRSCYHFWREVWLRRVEPPASDGITHK
jgi:hypothetical protein